MQREVSPVTGCCILRADFKNRHFTRNREQHFTGISQKSTFCP
nr:vitamin B12-binding protein [Ligilactobacillus ruminis]